MPTNIPDTFNYKFEITPELAVWFEKIIRILMVRDIARLDDKWVAVQLMLSPTKPPFQAWLFLSGLIGFDATWANGMEAGYQQHSHPANYYFQLALDNSPPITSMLFRQYCQICSLNSETAVVSYSDPIGRYLLELKLATFKH
jgi:hypothetical protein